MKPKEFYLLPCSCSSCKIAWNSVSVLNVGSFAPAPSHMASAAERLARTEGPWKVMKQWLPGITTFSTSGWPVNSRKED